MSITILDVELGKRSWSLLDIVNMFNAFLLGSDLRILQANASQFGALRNSGQGSHIPSHETMDSLMSILSSSSERARAVGFTNYLRATELAKITLGGGADCSTIAATIGHIVDELLADLGARKFLKIDGDRSDYLDTPDLFGGSVYVAFLSARKDIKEAGNCMAAECNTAAVFHLMRAAEFALRALARDRNISFSDKPLEEQEWGKILSVLDGDQCLKKLRNADRKNWASADVRDTQIRFYNDVVQELRGFNDAWRRHVSHADTEAFYNRESAMGIFEHVRTFMQRIAEKISESSVTKEYWDSI